MKESHTEGPASHGDPESCVGAREGTGEALTGAHTGGVLSREVRLNQGADAVVLSGRQHARIPGNWEAIGAFRTQVARMWYKTLRRRSQRTRITWDRMTKIVHTWLPRARILHPWPEQRCAAIIQGRSRMR
jgi:hypothetical protein